MQREKYIRASDIGTHAFCPRALHLKDQGAPTILVREQEAGIEFHARHGERVRKAVQRSNAAALFLLVGIFLTALAVWLWVH